MTQDEIDQLVFPVYVRPKLRGVYCKILGGTPLDKFGAKIPNRVAFDILTDLPPFEGYLTVGEPTESDAQLRSELALSDAEGTPKFTYYVSDVVLRARLPFNQRLDMLMRWAVTAGRPNLGIAYYNLVRKPESIAVMEAKTLKMGHLGIIIRSPDSYYAPPSFEPKEIH